MAQRTTRQRGRNQAGKSKASKARNTRAGNGRGGKGTKRGKGGVLRGLWGMPRQVRRRRTRARGWMRSLRRLLISLGQELRGTRTPEPGTAGVRIGPKGAAGIGPSRGARSGGTSGRGGGFAAFQRSRPDLFGPPDLIGWDEPDTGWDEPDDSDHNDTADGHDGDGTDGVDSTGGGESTGGQVGA